MLTWKLTDEGVLVKVLYPTVKLAVHVTVDGEAGPSLIAALLLAPPVDSVQENASSDERTSVAPGHDTCICSRAGWRGMWAAR